MSIGKHIISSNPGGSDSPVSSRFINLDSNASFKYIFPKEQNPTFKELIEKLKDTSPADTKNLSKIHIELMDAYFKNRKADPTYIHKSTFHAKEALLNGENTGLASYRLMVNLIKQKKLHQAIEVCAIVTDTAYQFSASAIIKKAEFCFKMKQLKRKIRKNDKLADRFFNNVELDLILKNSHDNFTSKE